MNTRKRIGSCIPIEYIHPYNGSMLAYGIIIGWLDSEGHPTSRKRAAKAAVEMASIVSEWSQWAEENAWIQDPFSDEDQFDEQHIKDRCKWIT